eukprot:CAMPEP_0114247320 /NCGR_PEP_ID=MMETSP0058-20121206/12959_1 /TAXON_ID=36894 /ORGANISM="Pyramimonas parkeae, CCMP726" /LENGTH=753 /DNA_ID=CAMNT_0001360617 /DNA_START=75 /DNA_END=2336 /DNA_ORIENTATION=+
MADDFPDVMSPVVKVAPGLVGAALSLIFIMYLRIGLYKAKVGKDISHPRLDFLSAKIKSGAMAFLKEEYKFLGYFVLVVGLVLLLLFSVSPQEDDTDGVRMMAAFFVGAGLSALAGYGGMMVATDGNVRTTVACTAGTLNDGLKVAFATGAIMGFTVVGLGLGGVSCMYLLVGLDYNNAATMQVLTGFGFGASSIALFARVAGGIYTKAADVGADLVGKVEAGIDEDDPHNPAVIADNVGDNVGDVAGMGADLFESYVGSIIAAATLADTDARVALPFWLAGAGIVCSIIGFFAVHTKEEGAGWNSNLGALMFALEKGMYTAGGLFLGSAAVVVYVLDGLWDEYFCILIGLVAGMLIGKFTEYFTSFDFAPVISIKDRGVTGPATVVIQGLGVGMISCVPTVLILCVTIIVCNQIRGEYGVAIAAVGMLATLGITLATDAYGPVADNAGGLAEMDPKIPKEVRGKTDALDALGNTTAATGKGFAIGSAVLTSLSLLAAFKAQVGMSDADLNLADAVILAGVLFGAMLPYMFAALTMVSVGKAAAEIITEVRRQFAEIPGLKACIIKASEGLEIPPEEDVDPDSDKCVAISTRSSVREMLAPGTYAVLAPLVVGFLVGPRCLMGLLTGAIASGCMVAIMMSNAGGAWDNGKKLCEKLGIKKTEQGKACVVGDTVGDPFKDTSGPSLNILIKLMSMVSLTVAPLLKGNDDWDNFYYGFIPLGLFVLATFYLVKKEILTWKDPLEAMVSGATSQQV